MIPLSFALRKDSEPNLCNVRLARATERIGRALNALGIQYIVSSQWEVAMALRVSTVHIVTAHHNPEQDLDSEEVIAQSLEAFKVSDGVDYVIPIAQPFLQLHKVQQQIINSGYKLFWPLKSYWLIGWIGFDKESDQLWTRSAPALVMYALDQMKKGKLKEKVS